MTCVVFATEHQIPVKGLYGFKLLRLSLNNCSVLKHLRRGNLIY